MRVVDTDTQLCISIASKPGNFGNLFHNFLYEALGLNFVYKSCAVADLERAIHGIRALGIRGCGVSMPFKIDILKHLDEIDATARAIGAVNTVVNENGRLKGFNTDYFGIRRLLERESVSPNLKTAVLGSGGAAKAVLKALSDLGFRSVTVRARNAAAGAALADAFGYKFESVSSTGKFEFLVNATPVGFKSESGELPFNEGMIEAADALMDVVGTPPRTAFLSAGQARGKRTLSGFEMSYFQACEQFRLYTGRNPSDEIFRSALEYCRSKS